MRRGEVLALTWANVDLIAKTAYLPVTKNGHSCAVPLVGDALTVLEEMPRGDGRVFSAGANGVTQAWIRARQKARRLYEAQYQREGIAPDPEYLLHARLHDARHTRATELAEAGLSVIELSTVTGHRTLSQLARYARVRPAALVDRLNKLG